MVSSYFYPHSGGVEKHILHVSNEFKRRGHAVDVLTVKYDKNLLDFENIYGMDVYRIPQYSKSFLSRFLKLLWFIKRINVFSKYDVIHFHDSYFQGLRLIAPTIPSFVTFHGYERPSVYQNYIESRKKVEKSVDGVVCVSTILTKWYGTKPDKVIYGGVDISAVKSDERKQYDVVFVGRLEIDRQILLYLESIRLLKEKYFRAVSVVVCGDGSLMNQAKQFSNKHGLGVKFVGMVENPEAYISKTWSVFASGYLSIIEAMAAKKMVFTIYDNPLQEDAIKSFPNSRNVLISSDNPSDIAAMMDHYLGHPREARKVTNTAYDWAKKQTWSHVAQTYLDLYKEKSGVR